MSITDGAILWGMIVGPYWKIGMTAAAWCAMAFGVVMFVLRWMATCEWRVCQAFMSTCLPSFWDGCLQRWPQLTDRFPNQCPVPDF